MYTASAEMAHLMLLDVFIMAGCSVMIAILGAYNANTTGLAKHPGPFSKTLKAPKSQNTQPSQSVEQKTAKKCDNNKTRPETTG